MGNKIFSKNVVARRKALGMSQEDLAGKVDVHPNIIKKIEGSRSTGKESTKNALAKALRCSVSDLYYEGPGERNIEPQSRADLIVDLITILPSLNENQLIDLTDYIEDMGINFLSVVRVKKSL